MRQLILRAGLMPLPLALSTLCAVVAAAQPGTGTRETVNQSFTTKQPHSPTGLSFSASYHAADDQHGNPPYMRRVVFDPPRGMRYDTSVPESCSASDAELRVMGPAACPAGSRLGNGTVEGRVMEPVAHDFAIDHFKHPVDVVNNANEQILLIKSEGYTVVRGHIRPDGSMAWNTPTCFPSPPAGGCVDDYILQLKSSTVLAPYKRTMGGRVRSYATTPAKCPASGYWRTKARFWWRDGSVDRVVSKQPCRRKRR
jgi:hypothetical protein